ncbi:MAG: hypothetical protein CMJ34_05340 [Phycisphaerae bacterium]|nr:hypothetical protein [Phycisphaerae bacterium]
MSSPNDESPPMESPVEEASGTGPVPGRVGRAHPVMAGIFRGIVCLLVLALGAGIAISLTVSAPTPARVDRSDIATPVVVIEPISEPVARRWRGFGTMHPSMTSMVPSRVASTVESLHEGLDVGMPVKEGEVIVRLDPEDYQRQAESAAERLVQIDAEIDRLDSELETSRARLEIANRALELAEQDLVRVRDAQGRGAAVQREIDTAEQQVLTARRGQVTIEELVSTLPIRRRALVAQQDELISARRLAESQVDRCLIKAPFDGVVAAVMVEVGEQVGPGVPIARVFDPSLIELPLRIPASARGRVAVGDRVIINRTVTDEPIHASITRIAPEDDAGSRTMTVFIELDADGGRVVPGLFVHGEVIESESVARSVVPRRSVVNQQVMLVEDGRIRFEPVSILFPLNEERPASGLADTQWLVLENPIPEGDLLVVDGGRSFESGMAVDPRAPISASGSEAGGDDS